MNREEYPAFGSKEKLSPSPAFDMSEQEEILDYHRKGGEPDFGLGRQQQRTEKPDSLLDPGFYGYYESLDPSIEASKKTRTVPEQQHPSPTSTPPPSTAEPVNLPEFPAFPESSQFFTPNAYGYENSDDPWEMQQQAFAELNTCYANEPTLAPRFNSFSYRVLLIHDGDKYGLIADQMRQDL